MALIPATNKHFGMTGTKVGMTSDQKTAFYTIATELRADGYLFLHEGDCVGADENANDIWRELGGKVYSHPPVDQRYRAFSKFDLEAPAKPYLKRDHDIVDVSEFMVAFPKGFGEELRSGTWATVRYARKVGKAVFIVWPNGSIKREINVDARGWIDYTYPI